MKLVPILLAIVGLIIAIVYAFEAFFAFQGNGASSLFFTKAIICLIGCYFFWKNIQRIKQSSSPENPSDAP